MKLTVVTVAYNVARTIRDCLESVRNQTAAVEHIIIDGGSTDGTLEIIEEYRPFLVKIVSEPDRGIYDGMNKGIRLATGDVVGLLNADDVYAGPEVLSRVQKVFEEQKCDSCYGDLVYVSSGNLNKVIRYWKAGNFESRRFYWGWMPPHPTFFVRREIYQKYGLFRLDLGSAADYELMLRFLVKQGISASYVPEVLVKMRTGGASNASLKKRLAANKNDRLAWEVNGLKPYPWTLYCKPLRKIGQYFLKPARVG